ncbi:MAG TPA: hypothetical protein VGC45_01440 [Gryllotalpicola sp.]
MLGIVDALIRGAVQRWPAAERDGLDREWRAELAMLDGEGGGWRHVRALRFAASLAWSGPSVERDGRELVRAGGRAALPLLLVLAVPLLAVLTILILTSVANGDNAFLPSDTAAAPGSGAWTLTSTVDAVEVLAVSVLTVLLAAFLGRRAGRRLPLVRTADGVLRAAAVAAAGPLLLGVGLVGVMTLPLGGEVYPATGPLPLTPLTVAAVAVWTAAMTVGLWWATRLPSAAGHGLAADVAPLTAVLATALGGILLLAAGLPGGMGTGELAASIARALTGFPLGLDPAYRFGSSGAGDAVLSTVEQQQAVDLAGGRIAQTIRLLAAASAFLLAFHRAAVIAPAAAPRRAARAVAPRGRRGWVIPVVTTVLLGAGILMWADALTLELGHATLIEHHAGDAPGTVRLELGELRQLAILLTTLALLLRLRRLAAGLPAALLTGGGLLAADAVFDRLDAEGGLALLAALAIGAGIVAAAILAASALGPRAADRNDALPMTRIAVVAAACAPWPLASAEELLPVGRVPSAVLTAAGGVVAILIGLQLGLAALAAVCAILARRARGHRAGGVVVLAAWLPAALLVVASAGVGGPILVDLLLAAGPLLAVFFAALARTRRLRGSAWWWLGIAAAAVVSGYPLLFLALGASLAISPLLETAAGYGIGADGLPFVAGAALIGVALALSLGGRQRAVRPEAAIAAPEPRVSPSPAS